MCGIVYQYNFDGSPTNNRVLKQFKRQQRRGTTSFGFALPTRHVMSWRVKYEDIARDLRRTKEPEVLFHHRLSTSTADRVTSCHPFSTKDWFETEFVGVHNGVLWNEHDLYEKHKERFPGLRYVSDNGKDFNDSEAYVYDLASYITGKIDGIEMQGYGAFILVEFDKSTRKRLRLHWGTTDTTRAPLRVHHTQKHLDITSEGKGWMVEKDTHYVYDYETGDITSSELKYSANKVRSKYSPYSYGGGYWHDDDDYYTPPKNSTLSDYDQAMVDESNEAIIEAINAEYPESEHYGWSMFPNGCCEACDEFLYDEESVTPEYTAQALSAEYTAVQRVLEAQASK